MPARDRDIETEEAPASPREAREKKLGRSKSDRPRPERSDSSREKERRERDKDRDRDRDREGDKSRDDKERKTRSKPTRSSRPKYTEDGSYVSYAARRYKPRGSGGDDDSETRTKKTRSLVDLVPELIRSGERVAVPYPSFSKAHSKEVVASRENLSGSGSTTHKTERRTGGSDPLTPEATDVGSAGAAADDMVRSKSVDFGTGATRRKSSTPRKGSGSRPPSPPDTNLSGEKSKDGTPLSVRTKRDLGGERPRSRTMGSRSASRNMDGASKVSRKSTTSSQATFLKSPPLQPPYVEVVNSDLAEGSEHGSQSTATSVLPPRKQGAQSSKPAPIEIVDDSPESAQDSISPKTPVLTTPPFPPPPPMFHQAFDKAPFRQQDGSGRPTPVATPFTDVSRAGGAPPPPPPPPPPPALNIQQAPRVDYLMQNGGLPSVVPRNFLAVLPRQNGTRPSNPPLRGPETLFAPFFNLLDQYQSVLGGHGSIAVATGHRTVARRLLDRLENVFNRDLPTEGCQCVMCEQSAEPHRGLGWGEVLERVSGRVEIPTWPPFDMSILRARGNEAISPEIPARPASPVKMDPDIAEEFREHYLRQSKKVKSAVDKWLNNCAEAPAPPPQEVDDETLIFAILTSLDNEDRPYFNALLAGSKEITPIVRAPTPARKPRADFIVKTGLAIQRLHRLPVAPRDAETACYLVKYPETHDLLSTIHDINRQEWEILTSGRFDGFLWSGADGNEDEATTPIGGPSRGPTPGFFPPRPPPPPQSRNAMMSPGPGGIGLARNTSAMGFNTMNSGGRSSSFGQLPPGISRGPTPASFVSGTSSAFPPSTLPAGGGGTPQNRAAVSNDEESEIAALAELEREIYLGMEALEDAFEVLHTRAESVRTALRTRGAGLSMGLQSRRGLGLDPSQFSSAIPGGPGNDATPVEGRPYWAATPGPEDESEMSGVEGVSESEAGDADGWDTGDLESIAPDDSASNISSSRRRRPRRRDERRTPAPIQEEDES